MNLKTCFITLFVAILTMQAASAQESGVYIRQENIRVPGITTDAQIDTLSLINKQTTYQYTDGLGRPVQAIGLKASPMQKDVIQPVAYDNLGRQSTGYLPYTDGGTDGSFRSDATTAEAAFYSASTPNNLIARDGSPFSSQVFENSPLQRLLSSGMVGDGFQPAAGQHYKKISYRGNTSSLDGGIFVWGPDGVYTPGTLYGDNSLSVTDGTDEDNTDTRTFTDRTGRTILKRQLHAGGNYDTYYVYNTAGMVSYIIPPKATQALAANSYNITSAPLNTMVFAFTYDGRGRPTSKTVPAKGTMYIVYDAWSRPVLMQDANMKAGNKWSYIKYDPKGRAISQGIYVDAVYTTQAAMQAHVNTLTSVWYESRSGTLTNGGYYTNTAFPSTGITPLAYAYFDDYDLNQDGTDNFAYIIQTDSSLPNEETATTAKLRGVPTMISKTTIGAGITAGAWLTRAIFYDKRGNVIQEQSNNHVNYTGATTLTDIKTVVNNFTGAPTASKVVKKTGASTTVTVYTAFTYDHMYRLTGVSQKYNTGSMQQIAAYTYNEIGQVIKKGLGFIAGGTIPSDLTLSGTISGTNTKVASNSIIFSSNPATVIPSGSTFEAIISTGYLQSVDYRYNIRGQLLSINNSRLSNDGGITNNTSDDLFGMQLLYDKVDADLGNTALFNGKLSAVKWMSKDAAGTSTSERSYAYSYDDLGRYTGSGYAERPGSSGAFSSNAGGFDESGITYDSNGNVLTLNRNSSTPGTNPAIQTAVDHLAYTYDSTNPNRLQKVSDGTGANYTGYGFRNLTGATSAAVYTYDANGNLAADPYKGISLTYNDLNRTGKITVTTATNRFINYTYDASGSILRKQAYDNNVLQTTTDYIDGFVYVNGTLSYFPMPEGRVRNTGAALKPEYIISDQQGNARISFEEGATAGQAVVRQENSYYAFGLVLPNSPVGTPATDNKQLYNGGSEWQNDYSNLPDYYQTFNRNYDAALGRFVGVDPMAEATESLSSYNYAGNNPVSYNDPNGDFQTNPFIPGFNQQVGDIWTTQSGFGSSTSTGSGGSTSGGGISSGDGNQNGAAMTPDQAISSIANLLNQNNNPYGGYSDVSGIYSFDGNVSAINYGFSQLNWGSNGGYGTLGETYDRYNTAHPGNGLLTYTGSGWAVVGTYNPVDINGNSQIINGVSGTFQAVWVGNASQGGLNAAGTATDIVGGLYGAAGKLVLNGDQWLGKNGKYYSTDWGGNGYTGSRAGALEAAGMYKWAGRATVGAAVVIGGLQVYGGYRQDGGYFGYHAQTAAAGATGGLIGGWAGAEGGAAAGAAIGVWFGGVGALPGAVIGGFVGGFFGSQAGSSIGSGAVNYYYDQK